MAAWILAIAFRTTQAGLSSLCSNLVSQTCLLPVSQTCLLPVHAAVSVSMCFGPIISSIEEWKKVTGTLLLKFQRLIFSNSIPYFSYILPAKAPASSHERNSGSDANLDICSVAAILNDPKAESATTYLTHRMTGTSPNYWMALRQATAPIDRPHSIILLNPLPTKHLTISRRSTASKRPQVTNGASFLPWLRESQRQSENELPRKGKRNLPQRQYEASPCRQTIQFSSFLALVMRCSVTLFLTSLPCSQTELVIYSFCSRRWGQRVTNGTVYKREYPSGPQNCKNRNGFAEITDRPVRLSRSPLSAPSSLFYLFQFDSSYLLSNGNTSLTQPVGTLIKYAFLCVC